MREGRFCGQDPLTEGGQIDTENSASVSLSRRSSGFSLRSTKFVSLAATGERGHKKTRDMIGVFEGALFLSGKSMTKDAALDHSSHCDVCVRPSCRENLSCVFYAINSPLRDGLSLSPFLQSSQVSTRRRQRQRRLVKIRKGRGQTRLLL